MSNPGSRQPPGEAHPRQPRRLRILHISDLHQQSASNSSQALIVSEMILDVCRLAEAAPIDLVVFTGDLADKGKEAEFEAAERELLVPLIEALGLPADRLILVPGNHDIDRDHIDRLLEPGLAQLSDSESVDNVLANPSHCGPALERLQAWRRFRTVYYERCPEGVRPVDLNPLTSVHELNIGGLKVGVAVLDSAWRATGAPNDGDRGHLLIGESQTRAALDAIRDCDVRVAAFHHPLEWLAPWDHQLLREMLERERVFVMTGHEHVPNPTVEKSVRGEAVYSRAGCLYGSRDYPNGYALLDLDLRAESVTMRLRTWFPKRKAFDGAVDVVEGGMITMPFPKKAGTDYVARPAYPAVTSALAMMAYNQNVLSGLPRDRDPTSVDEVLVPPQFYPAPFQQVAAAVGLAKALAGRTKGIKRLNAPALLDKQRVVIVTGNAEAGVSSALYWVLDQRYGTDFAHVPVRTKYAVRSGRDSFERLIREAAKDTGLLVGPRDARPPLVVAIDDVTADPGSGLERLARHIAAHEEDLFVLGCHGDDHHAVRAALVGAGVECTVAHLGPFGRRQTRSLVIVMGLDAAVDHLDRIFEVAFGENLPRTPFVLAALVAVLVAQPDARPPNVSSLLDAVADLLLGKANPGYVEAGLDFRRREHLLEFLAAHLVEAKTLTLPRGDAERLIADYFENRGFERSMSAGNVLNSLLKSHILIEGVDGVTFSHGSLMYVLAAKFMMEDRLFCEQVLADPLDWVHSEVVRHAAGLRRSDRDLLRLVADATMPAITRAMNEIVCTFDAIKLDQPASLDPESLEQAIKQSVPKPREQIEQERDSYYERRELAASAPDDLALPELTVSALHSTMLLSWVLAASELVEDPDLKTELLKRAVTAWGVLGEDLGAQTADWEPLRFLADQIIPPEKVRNREEAWHVLVRLLSVIATGAMVGGILNSPGLSAAVRRLAQDDEIKSSPKASLYVTMLFSALRLPGYVDQLKETLDRHRQHVVVASILQAQAVQKCLSPETPDSEANRLMAIVADQMISEAGGPDAVARRSAERSRAIGRLRTERLQHRTDQMGDNLVEDVLGIDGQPS